MEKREKEKFVFELNARLKKAQGSFLVEYKGLNVEDINRLRNEIRKTDAEFQVVKNRLLKLASEGTETGLLKDSFYGPSAIALTYEDVVGLSKVLVDCAKDFDRLIIKCGQISGKVIDYSAIKKLARLPAKDVLLSMLLSTMQAVPVSFVRVLNGVTTNLLNVLKAIEKQKEE